MMKKVLILEDNLALLRKEASIVHNLDYKCEVISCDNPKDAMADALSGYIDLFIIDIILDLSHPGDMSGLHFADNIRKIGKYAFTPIIMVTGLEDPKLYSYEYLHCYSFVEKPFDPEALRGKIMQCLQFPGHLSSPNMLKFRKDGIIHLISEDDLAYAEVSAHQMYLHKTGGEVLIVPYYTIQELKKCVNSDIFCQCNRHCLVNKSAISTIDYTNGVLQLVGGLGKLDIGRSYKNEIKEFLSV